MKLVEEGCADGLKTQEACEAVGITDRTYRNWKRLGNDDGRTKRTNFTSTVRSQRSIDSLPQRTSTNGVLRRAMRGGATNRRHIWQRRPIVSGRGTLRIFVQADTRDAFTMPTSSLTFTVVTSSPRAFMRRTTLSTPRRFCPKPSRSKEYTPEHSLCTRITVRP